MNAELRRQIQVNAAWLVGLGVVSVGLVSGTSAWLDAGKTRTEARARELSDLTARVELNAEEEALDSGIAVAALNAARTIANGESLRIEQLAAAARAADVTVVALRGRPVERRADGRVVVCAHELEISGDYRHVARFLGALQRAPGTVGVEELEIEPNEPNEPGEAAGRVKAALVVAWFAPGVVDVAAPAEEGAG